MLTCQEGPTRPPPQATQKDAALVVLDLEEALSDCKAKLSAIGKIMTR
jgi:hypothetical protein